MNDNSVQVQCEADSVQSESTVLARLMAVIQDRRARLPQDSYTTKLFQGGQEKIVAKLLEEAAETAQAAGEPGDDGRKHFIYETGDLLYHLLVLLASRDVSLSEVEEELARRFGVSGLEEKSARGRSHAQE